MLPSSMQTLRAKIKSYTVIICISEQDWLIALRIKAQTKSDAATITAGFKDKNAVIEMHI